MRRRLTRRQKNKRNKQIIMVSTICLLVVMGVGYAAFSTQLSLKAKGNILKKAITPEKLKESVVDSGDGLYKDIYEDGKYFYRGANPNNYITFNNETWRIVSVESDNTVKIIRNELLTESSWSSGGTCYEGSGWRPEIGSGCNKWDAPALLNTYLNDTYLKTININNEKIVPSIWYIGGIPYGNIDLASQIAEENKTQSKSASIGLITVSEYIRASNNTEQCSNFNLNNDNYETCQTTNWLYKNLDYWTITALSTGLNNGVLYINNGKIEGQSTDGFPSASRSVFPVLYLSSDITLSGTGTQQDPYIITN